MVNWRLEEKNRLKSSKIEDCAKIETDFEKLSKLKKKLTLTDYEMYSAWQSNPFSLVSSTMDGQMIWWTWNLEKKIRLKSSKIKDCAKIETEFEKTVKIEKKHTHLLWQTMKCIWPDRAIFPAWLVQRWTVRCYGEPEGWKRN